MLAFKKNLHSNAAFGIAFILDYTRKLENAELDSLLIERSQIYAEDEACPAAWEPDGEDLFSPCLMEADLMRRVMEPVEFRKWFHRFVPELAKDEAKTLLEAAQR